MEYLLLIGLILNFVGMVLIAISFGGTVEAAQQTDSEGRKIYLAALSHPRAFLFGMTILGLGFLLQIISEVAAFFRPLAPRRRRCRSSRRGKREVQERTTLRSRIAAASSARSASDSTRPCVEIEMQRYKGGAEYVARHFHDHVACRDCIWRRRLGGSGRTLIEFDEWGRAVPITPFLGDQQLDPETKRMTDVAFEMARAVVERDWGNYADGIQLLV